MSYRHLHGVQSVPRVMRGAPVVMPIAHDVSLSARHLDGIADQGIAHTLTGITDSIRNMSKTTMVMVAASAVGLLYYLSKR